VPGGSVTAPAYRVPFTVRAGYFGQIEAGTKTREVRRATRRWRTVAAEVNRRASSGPADRAVATFLCGRRVHRRVLTHATLHETASAALGRDPSPDGQRDLGDGPVVAFHLGAVVGAT
jgi:hypothetical protein